jgi:hypothetical protein
MILGLGVSHQPVNAARPWHCGATRPKSRAGCAAKGPVTHLLQEPAPVPVPLYLVGGAGDTE